MQAQPATDVLATFQPLVAAWFRERVGEPTAPQREGWPLIASGRDVLIAAPTGSGKTLAAFLACIDQLIGRALHEGLSDRTHIVYVSPLKALSNDIQKNLEGPLAELAERARAAGEALPELRVGVRTGDTPVADRERMAKRPPHILVTTPESLYILLTSERGRAGLRSVSTVIVDEIHALAGDKRGAHLALTLERLDHWVKSHGGAVPVRVGLSATQRPIERVARLLVGNHRALPHIIDGGHRRAMDLAIELTDDELGAVASHEQMGRVYDRIAELVRAHKTTLVFTNTRRMVERVAAALEDRLGEDAVVAHHGALSRTLRLRAEEKLKTGKVACAVATASLELGIDVGAVDLVVQLGSPRLIATLLQRVGRSGHSIGGLPKGRLFALTRDQLLECGALVRAVRRGILDEVFLREAPLDILAQQLVAITAAEPDGIDEAVLRHLVQGAANYANLTDAQWEQLLLMLSEGVSERRPRMGAQLHRDRVAGRVRARKGARLLAITCGGAIPDNQNYPVVQIPNDLRVGEVDEDFAIDSSAGDIFQLGNAAWKIERVEAGRVLVSDATGQPPTIPFWFGEAPSRSRELSQEVSALRRDLDQAFAAERSPDELAAWLAAETAMPLAGAALLVQYLAAARATLGALPHDGLLIAERFFDEGGGMQLVLHAPLGGRLNRAWGLALRKRFCRSFDFELQAAGTDDGILVSLGQPHSFPLETVFSFLPSGQAEPVLVQAVLDNPAFEVRWRWNATRSLAVARRRGGKRVAPHLLRMRAADMLSVVFPQAQACGENITGDREIPDHPLVAETVRDCLTEALDGAGLTALMGQLERGEIQVLAVDTVEPSVLCHELINANPYAFLDDAGLEDRRTRAISVKRGLPATGSASQDHVLDEAAIARAETEATLPVRSADELHDALLATWATPAHTEPEARRWFKALCEGGRAVALQVPRPSTFQDAPEPVKAEPIELWAPIERAAAVVEAWPSAQRVPEAPLPAWSTTAERSACIQRVLAGWFDHRGPTTSVALAEALALPVADVVAGLLALEGDGAILRGRFTAAALAAPGPRGPSTARAALAQSDAPDELASLEWCGRRILARIHRLTLDGLRAQIEPVSAGAFMRFLLDWHRLGRHQQVAGVDGVATVLDQLQGFETAAGAWERELLPARVQGYVPAWLDQLCMGGQFAWCRLTTRLDGDEQLEPVPEAQQAALAELARGHLPNVSPDELTKLKRLLAVPRMTPSKSTPLTLFRRDDAGWVRAHGLVVSREGLSAAALAVHDALAAGGAMFLSDLAARTKRPAMEIESALWELVATGYANADGMASVRTMVNKRPGEIASAFDAVPDAPGPATPDKAAGMLPGAPRGSWQAAINKARNRDGDRPMHASYGLPTSTGRWALLAIPDPAVADAEAWALLLLRRYGVVFRDLILRERGVPPWREVLGALRRLEARGDIRGGRFVAGFVGEQFARPDVIEALRAVRHAPPAPRLVRVAATDPLNLVGILSPGPRVPAVLGNAILFRDGTPLASREHGKLVLRTALEPHERIDNDLTWQSTAMDARPLALDLSFAAPAH